MDLSAHLRVMLRRKWRILGASLLIAGLVFGWRSSVLPTYEATALVNVVSSQSLRGEIASEDDTVFLSESYAALATTTPIASAAGQRSGLGLSSRAAQRRVEVDVAEGSYLTIIATGPSPASASALSAAFADALIDEVEAQQQEQTGQQLTPVLAQIASVERDLALFDKDDPRRTALELQYAALVQNVTDTRVRPLDRILLVTPARTSPDPIDPKPKRDALLAMIVALVVNAELAVLLSVLAGRFNGTDVGAEISALTGLPVLGEIPQGANEHDPSVVEAFRTLRTSLLFLDSTGGLASIAVVGGERGSGKSFVALNLSRSLAGLERGVVLVDGDLRNPALHLHFGVRRVPGLVDIIGTPFAFFPPEKVRTEEGKLHLLPAGPKTDDPAGLLAGGGLSRLIGRLQPYLTIIDTPPLGLFADGVGIALNCSATLLVVDVDAARRRDVSHMLVMLRRVGVEPVGIVLNRVKGQRSHRYYAYRTRRPSNRSLRRPARMKEPVE